MVKPPLHFPSDQFCVNIRLESMYGLHKMLQIVRPTTALTVPELLLKTKPPVQLLITTLEYHSSLRGDCWTAHPLVSLLHFPAGPQLSRAPLDTPFSTARNLPATTIMGTHQKICNMDEASLLRHFRTTIGAWVYNT